VRGVRKAFRTGTREGKRLVQALAGVDLDVRRGELLVLLGPSGCGKTTLLRSIAGLEFPEEGEISIGGEVVYSSAQRICLGPERRSIGMMFQSYALWPHMTVRDNVTYPLRGRGGHSKAVAYDKAARVLESLGVGGLEHRYPSQLSGGQQQRVALARSLIAEPAVLLFDEPLSNVDARVRRHLRAQLRETLRTTQFAGVYVTHDQEEAMELADTLAVMDSGSILQIGSPREIYDAPASRFVSEFVGDINLLEAQVCAVHSSCIQATTSAGRTGWIELGAARVPAVGENGYVSFRPEHGVLGADGAGGLRIDAAIADVVFLGPRAEVRLRAAGTDMTLTSADASARGLVAGASASISVSDAHLRWIAR